MMSDNTIICINFGPIPILGRSARHGVVDTVLVKEDEPLNKVEGRE
jgi:hypothetical protein